MKKIFEKEKRTPFRMRFFDEIQQNRH